MITTSHTMCMIFRFCNIEKKDDVIVDDKFAGANELDGVDSDDILPK